MVDVDFYYSIGSRYSYLAATQIATLQRDTGCTVDWRPLNSVALIARRGGGPFDGPPPAPQYEWVYRERDAKRWAELYGVPFLEPRGRVEFDADLLARAAVAAGRLGRTADYSLTLFAAMFADLTVMRIDCEECLRRAAAVGLPLASFAAALDDSVTAAEHAQTIEQALAAGVFGVPSFVIDGELFWGNDRLVLLRRHLTRGVRTPT